MRPLALATCLVCAACSPATMSGDAGPTTDGGGTADSGGGGGALPVDCNDVVHTSRNPACGTPGAQETIGSGPSLITTDGFPSLGGGFVDGNTLVVAVQLTRTTSATDEGAVLSIDLGTGARTLVTGQLPHMTGGGVDARGTGPAFTGGLRDVQKGPDGDYGLAPHAVYKIDPATGNRTQVWDETTHGCDAGGGTTPSLFPTALAVGPDGTVYVPIAAFGAPSPAGIGGIRAGACTIVTFFRGPAGTDHGSGAMPAAANFRALRFAAGALWATTDTNAELYRIDPATGARTLVSTSSTPTTGTGPTLPTDFIDVSADGHHAWANRSGGGGSWELTAVDLTNGNRTAYDQPVVGPASMGQGGAVWAHPTHAWAILAMATAIVVYDPATHGSNVISY